MANLTLRIDDDLLAEARKTAASRETTVNRMIREYLEQVTEMVEKERKRSEKVRKLFEAMDDCGSDRPVPPLNREELHDRG